MKDRKEIDDNVLDQVSGGSDLFSTSLVYPDWVYEECGIKVSDLKKSGGVYTLPGGTVTNMDGANLFIQGKYGDKYSTKAMSITNKIEIC